MNQTEQWDTEPITTPLVFRGVVFALLVEAAFALVCGVILWFFLNGWSL